MCAPCSVRRPPIRPSIMGTSKGSLRVSPSRRTAFPRFPRTVCRYSTPSSPGSVNATGSDGRSIHLRWHRKVELRRGASSGTRTLRFPARVRVTGLSAVTARVASASHRTGRRLVTSSGCALEADSEIRRLRRASSPVAHRQARTRRWPVPRHTFSIWPKHRLAGSSPHAFRPVGRSTSGFRTRNHGRAIG